MTEFSLDGERIPEGATCGTCHHACPAPSGMIFCGRAAAAIKVAPSETSAFSPEHKAPNCWRAVAAQWRPPKIA